MKQLIDKSDLTAEIEKRIADNKKDIERASHKNLEDYFEGYEDALVLLKQQYIDTLETKEVDLEKALSDLDKDMKEFVTTEEFEIESETCGHYWAIAKHAFLLGLKTKGE